MRRERQTIAMICALSALGASASARATTTFSLPLEEGVRRAELVFAGSVSRAIPERSQGDVVTRYVFRSLEYAKGSEPGDSIALTATGGDIGGEGSVGVMRFTTGMRYVVAAAAGSDAAESTRRYWPLEILSGPFVVAADSGSGAPVVHGFQGWPVVAFRDYLLVLRNSNSWVPTSRALDHSGRVGSLRPPDLSPWTWADRDTTDPGWEREARAKAAAAGTPMPRHIHTQIIWRQRDPGTRVTEAEFLNQIRMIVREQAAADSAAARPPTGQVRQAIPVTPGPPAQETTPPQPPVRLHPGPGGK